MNTNVAPFDDARVRRAFALAIDRSQVKDVAYLGTGEEGLVKVPTGSKLYDDSNAFAAERDLVEAKRLLADAGYADGLKVEYLGLSSTRSCSRPDR